MRFLFLLLIALCPTFIVGCSVFVPSRQSVLITPTEPNANVFVDGAQVGTGTTNVELKRNKSHSVIAKVGNRSGSAQIDTKISTTGILDIVGGFLWLVPFVGIAAPGFHDLDATSVYVSIPPAPTQVATASYAEEQSRLETAKPQPLGVHLHGDCPQCHTKNESGRKFCRECGGSLHVACVSCNSPIPAWENFCGECGENQRQRVIQAPSP